MGSLSRLIIIIAVLDISSLTFADIDYNKYGLVSNLPGKSCKDIYQRNPSCHGNSDYYIVLTGDTLTPRFIYCDMELECGGERGWMRVAKLNASSDQCPDGWRKITSPVKACRGAHDNAGCYSTYFSTGNIPYSRVCGMMVGYQKGGTDGFANFRYSTRSINGPYVDGVSITYGTPRKHIWTYAIGHSMQKNQIIYHATLLIVHALNILVVYLHLLFITIIIVSLVRRIVAVSANTTLLTLFGMVLAVLMIIVAVLSQAYLGFTVKYQ